MSIPKLKGKAKKTTEQQKSAATRAEPPTAKHTTVKMPTRSANCFVNKKRNTNTKRVEKNAV